MTVREAQNILGVTKQEDDRMVKAKFRKLMTRYHPDAAGSESPEILRKAQLINEAYSVLCGRLEAGKSDSGKRKPAWKGRTVEEAFTERVIYRQLFLWEGEEGGYDEAARGKYEWDPELEDFSCLLKSVNQAVMELLENIETKNGFVRGEEPQWKEGRFAYQVRLFHLLAGQFIRPLSCLEKLAEPEEIDGQGRAIYRFRGLLGCKESGRIRKTMTTLKKGDFLKVVSLRDSRIMVGDREGALLGNLSLAEDQWYYVVIPILEGHLAQVKLIVTDVEVKRERRPFQVRVNVDLYLRMESMREPECSGKNSEILSVLSEYEAYVGRFL